MIELPDQLQSCANLFLMRYNNKWNVSSIYLNFLIAVFDSLTFTYPEYIDVTTARQYFAISATGCSLKPSTAEFSQLVRVSNIENFHLRVLAGIPAGFSFLAPIVWFTEYCLVDIATSTGTYRQSFLYGRPLAETITLPPDGDNLHYVGVNFTARPEIFGSTLVSLTDLKRVLFLWRKNDLSKGLPEGTQVPRLQFKWLTQSEYNYSLRIVPGITT